MRKLSRRDLLTLPKSTNLVEVKQLGKSLVKMRPIVRDCVRALPMAVVLKPHISCKYHPNSGENNKNHICISVTTFPVLNQAQQHLSLKACYGFDWKSHKRTDYVLCLALAVFKVPHAAGTQENKVQRG